MKLQFSLFVCVIFSIPVISQCTGGNFIGSVTPALSWQIVSGGLAGEYYTFTATPGTTYQFSYCPNNGGNVTYDSQLTLLDTNDIPQAYADDNCGLSSELVWTAVTGGTYRLLTSEFYCITNTISADLAYRILPPNPLDSVCNSQLLTVDAPPVLGDNLGASADVLALPSCWSDFMINNDIWYSFVAPPAGSVAIETFYVGNVATQLALYQANPPGNCNGSLTETGCNEFGGNNALIVASGLTPGETYFVRVDGYMGDAGAFAIQVRTAVPPANDSICNALNLIVDAFPTFTTNEYATAENLPYPSCFSDGGLDNTVWYTFTAPSGGAVEVKTFSNGGMGTGQMIVYGATPPGNCNGTLNELGCNEFGNNLSYLQLAGLNPGETYFILADGYFSQQGSFDIQVRTAPVLCNLAIPPGTANEPETCGINTNYGCNGFPYQFTTLNCGDAYLGTVYNDIFPNDEDWYKFTVNQQDTAKIRFQAQFDASVQIYDVNDCFNPILIAIQSMPACSLFTYNGFLAPSDYGVFIAPQFNHIVTCAYANEYWISYHIGPPLSPVSISDPGLLCVNDPPFPLQVIPSQTGSWSGNGISNQNSPNFNPTLAGQGIHAVTFTTVPTANGCSASDTIPLQVLGIPQANFSLVQNGNSVTVTDLSINVTSYSWNFGDGTTSTQAAPMHTYAQMGIYNIVLIATSPCGVSISNQLVNIGSLGMDEFMPAEFSVYPNPGDGNFNIQWESPSQQEVRVSVLDISGRAVYQQVYPAVPGPNTWNIRLESPAKGIYTIKLEGKSGTLYSRLIVI